MMGMLLMAMSACGGMEQPAGEDSLQTQEAAVCSEPTSEGWGQCRSGSCYFGPSGTHPCAGRECIDVDDCYFTVCPGEGIQCGGIFGRATP
ncbi:hypothetical protein D7W79_30140 [Corallococcus exercitus]|nr:hypothetical protein D7W79_30140 [Corallococcus exercitus]